MKKILLNKKTFIIIFLFLLSFSFGSFLERTGIFSISAKINHIVNSSGLGKVKNIIRYDLLKKKKNEDSKKIIYSNYYDFELTEIQRPSYSKYGGIDFFNEKILYVDKEGAIWIKENNAFLKINDELIPNNSNFFEKEFGKSSLLWFGVKDILVIEKLDESYLFASTNNYNFEEKCHYLSLYLKKIKNNLSSQTKWEPIFNTNCLKEHKVGKSTFMSINMSSGGRIAELNNEEILLSVGDYYFDGVNDSNKVNTPESLYGKIIKINFVNKKFETYADGVRNVQGLLITKNGIYSTEHGPQGGDELNFIEYRKNYGWPSATYGVNYRTKEWPLDKKNKNHSIKNFTKPMMSWIPSIAPSQLVEIKSDNELRRWDKDLLISSLKAKSLFRIKMKDFNNLILIEKINTDFRIRDIIEKNGILYLLEDGAPIIWKMEKINYPNK